MALKIVYIAGEHAPKRRSERKPSEKELLHREAIAAMARYHIRADEKAEKLFLTEAKEIEVLKDRLSKMY